VTLSAMPAQRLSPAGFVLAGGLVAGTLDIVYACVFWGLRADVPAQRIFQSVASGLLGQASFDGGWSTAALGLALHFFIATSMSVTYYLVALRWPLLHQRPVLSGAAYGTLLYLIMNYVVVPLSAAPRSSSKNALWIALSVLVHMFLIGVPIALFARRAIAARTR
jgi:uncharacterized membrane protein YagU involved in acid resistance